MMVLAVNGTLGAHPGFAGAAKPLLVAHRAGGGEAPERPGRRFPFPGGLTEGVLPRNTKRNPRYVKTHTYIYIYCERYVYT